MKLLILIILMISRVAHGGVGQGNPNSMLMNMSENYQISNYGKWSIRQIGDARKVRVDVDILHRGKGYFIIAGRFDASEHSEPLCRQQAVVSAAVSIFWLGSDCADPYYLENFEQLTQYVRGVGFPH